MHTPQYQYGYRYGSFYGYYNTLTIWQRDTDTNLVIGEVVFEEDEADYIHDIIRSSRTKAKTQKVIAKLYRENLPVQRD